MNGRLEHLAIVTPISQPIAPMRNHGVLIAACLISAPCQAAEVTRTTEDRCSLAVAAIEDRASIVCDGVATSKVTATVKTADGGNVANGLDANFSVQVLGTASPPMVRSTNST